ncbi:hypothetical protein EOD41_14490 [Mucilaginibacter limnophilus]|uniref:Uncharacterized protein n=1 Tax=Mucilaginibacter limnophilus TaxID=1932778 RepID=A0A437MR98_9SPHI|nr:hypothetical protein [Mucilaginibacter limnophilus]RVU00165.1 hypothetical protein EOD41_14490 [Mucilaginibacter limnophilus]
MTTVILKSDSESKIQQLLKLAEELGVSAEKQNDFVELDAKALAFGIGRPATDEEWDAYFAKQKHTKFLDLDEAFSKYLDQE